MFLDASLVCSMLFRERASGPAVLNFSQCLLGLLLVVDGGKSTERKVISPVECSVLMRLLHAFGPVFLRLDVLLDLALGDCILLDRVGTQLVLSRSDALIFATDHFLVKLAHQLVDSCVLRGHHSLLLVSSSVRWTCRGQNFLVKRCVSFGGTVSYSMRSEVVPKRLHSPLPLGQSAVLEFN